MGTNINMPPRRERNGGNSNRPSRPVNRERGTNISSRRDRDGCSNGNSTRPMNRERVASGNSKKMQVLGQKVQAYKALLKSVLILYVITVFVGICFATHSSSEADKYRKELDSVKSELSDCKSDYEDSSDYIAELSSTIKSQDAEITSLKETNKKYKKKLRKRKEKKKQKELEKQKQEEEQQQQEQQQEQQEEQAPSESDDSSDDVSLSDVWHQITGSYIPKEEEIIDVSAAQIVAEFDANQVACKQAYDGKYVRISTTVSSLGTTIWGKTYICLEDGDGNVFNDIQCFMYKDQVDKVASCTEGTPVTVVGWVDCGSMKFKIGDARITNF